jgi:hypothetical protein
MAIKNPDGSVYKLKGPNPLMKTQKLWENCVLFNMNLNNVEVVPDRKKKSVKSKPVQQDKIPEPVLEVQQVEVKNIEIELPEIELPKIELSDTLSEHKVELICLPVKIERIVDELYNTVTNQLSYGSSFVFEAFVTLEEDLFIEFWSTKLIEKHSIVYPRNVKKRWWDVSEIEVKSGGYLHKAYISDYNPDFS